MFVFLTLLSEGQCQYSLCFCLHDTNLISLQIHCISNILSFGSAPSSFAARFSEKALNYNNFSSIACLTVKLKSQPVFLRSHSVYRTHVNP